MGIRIEAFAVDLSRLAAFLDYPLAELLQWYARDSISSDEELVIIDSQNRDRFSAVASGDIRGSMTVNSQRSYLSLDAGRLREIPFLWQKASAYLSTDSAALFNLLMRPFSRCRGVEFIRQIIDGHRRWWVGSLLQTADAAHRHDRPRYELLVELFRKILRGSNCGYTIPDGDVGLDVARLPFAPEYDPDIRIGRWTERDCQVATTVLSELNSNPPIFTRPSELRWFELPDSEWQAWVAENIAALLEIQRLDYGQLNLLTTIG